MAISTVNFCIGLGKYQICIYVHDNHHRYFREGGASTQKSVGCKFSIRNLIWSSSSGGVPFRQRILRDFCHLRTGIAHVATQNWRPPPLLHRRTSSSTVRCQYSHIGNLIFRAAVFELHISRIVQQAKSVYLVKTYRNTLTLHKLLLMWLKGYLILFRFLVVKLNFGFTSTETQRMMLHLWDIFFILREVLRAVIARLFCSFIDYHCI